MQALSQTNLKIFWKGIPRCSVPYKESQLLFLGVALAFAIAAQIVAVFFEIGLKIVLEFLFSCD